MNGNNAKPNSQVKHERFVRVAEKRVDTLIHDFYMLGKCADRNVYEYTEHDVQIIRNELERQFSTLMEKFEGKHRFTLTQKDSDAVSSADTKSESSTQREEEADTDE